jgi:hypothetical protein
MPAMAWFKYLATFAFLQATRANGSSSACATDLAASGNFSLLQTKRSASYANDGLHMSPADEQSSKFVGVYTHGQNAWGRNQLVNVTLKGDGKGGLVLKVCGDDQPNEWDCQDWDSHLFKSGQRFALVYTVYQYQCFGFLDADGNVKFEQPTGTTAICAHNMLTPWTRLKSCRYFKCDAALNLKPNPNTLDWLFDTANICCVSSIAKWCGEFDCPDGYRRNTNPPCCKIDADHCCEKNPECDFEKACYGGYKKKNNTEGLTPTWSRDSKACCDKADDGAYCTGSEQCQSNDCKRFVRGYAGVCIGPNCNGNRGIGDSCEFDACCKSGFCFNSTCTDTYQDGEFCKADNWCRSNVCRGNKCGKRQDGDSCSEDEWCQSSLCRGNKCGKRKDGDYCKEADWCQNGCRGDKCGKRLDGESCDWDDWCQSNWCRDKKCGKRQDGDSCEWDDWCQSGSCQDKKCSKKKQDGDYCSGDNWCRSNWCRDKKCGKRQDGDSCSWDDWCQSNWCRDKKCGKRQDGDSCSWDDWCQSGWCHEKQCKPRKQQGESCWWDTWCKSGKCSKAFPWVAGRCN